MQYSERLSMQKRKFSAEIVAPYGMNCGISKRYLTYSRGIPQRKGIVIHCSGCFPRNKDYFIKRGCNRLGNKINFCFECKDMPFRNLDRLDKRYRKRYNINMVENQKELRERHQRIPEKSKKKRVSRM